MATAYIGLGSNLNNPISQVTKALMTFKHADQVQLIAQSSLYRTKPFGPQNQPDYINAVAMIHTKLEPLALLQFLQHIETDHGRVRDIRWGPRTLDLDLLLYDDLVMQTAELNIPHIGIKQRESVLYPLAEISKDLKLPSGETLTELISQCPKNDLCRI